MIVFPLDARVHVYTCMCIVCIYTHMECEFHEYIWSHYIVAPMVWEIVCIRTKVVLYCMAVYIEAHSILLHFMITVFYKLKVCSNPRLSDDGEHFLAITCFLIKLCTLGLFFKT